MFCFKLLQALNREAQKEWDMYIYIYMCVSEKRDPICLATIACTRINGGHEFLCYHIYEVKRRISSEKKKQERGE